MNTLDGFNETVYLLCGLICYLKPSSTSFFQTFKYEKQSVQLFYPRAHLFSRCQR